MKGCHSLLRVEGVLKCQLQVIFVALNAGNWRELAWLPFTHEDKDISTLSIRLGFGDKKTKSTLDFWSFNKQYHISPSTWSNVKCGS